MRTSQHCSILREI